VFEEEITVERDPTFEVDLKVISPPSKDDSFDRSHAANLRPSASIQPPVFDIGANAAAAEGADDVRQWLQHLPSRLRSHFRVAGRRDSMLVSILLSTSSSASSGSSPSVASAGNNTSDDAETAHIVDVAVYDDNHRLNSLDGMVCCQMISGSTDDESMDVRWLFPQPSPTLDRQKLTCLIDACYEFAHNRGVSVRFDGFGADVCDMLVAAGCVVTEKQTLQELMETVPEEVKAQLRSEGADATYMDAATKPISQGSMDDLVWTVEFRHSAKPALLYPPQPAFD
jgi:hypothetical protein